MEQKFELLPCVGLSDRCPAVKRADKFAQEIEESANSLQQLKAEIAALINVLAACYQVDDGKRFSETIIKLRQLSAV